MSFSDHGINEKLVDHVKIYQNMKFQPKVMTHSRENGQKPIFWKIAYKKKLRFFGENRASSLFYIYNRLTCCKKSEKSNDGKYDNFCYRQTDWRPWIHRTRGRVQKTTLEIVRPKIADAEVEGDSSSTDQGGYASVLKVIEGNNPASLDMKRVTTLTINQTDKL